MNHLMRLLSDALKKLEVTFFNVVVEPVRTDFPLWKMWERSLEFKNTVRHLV